MADSPLFGGRLLLWDGATGTELQKLSLPAYGSPGSCAEAWNLDHPDRILSLHRRYLEAGARVLTTNTFGANLPRLTPHQLADRQEALIREAVRLARTAAEGHEAWVLGSVGPTTLGRGLSRASYFDVQIQALLDANADGILIETMTDVRELLEAIEACKRAGSPYTVASVAFQQDPRSPGIHVQDGTSPEDVALLAEDRGADALGLNCGYLIDIDAMCEGIRRYRSVSRLPILARPNAGQPIQSPSGGWTYPMVPTDMVEAARRLIEAGANAIGGCCGTTPDHIAELHHALF